MVKRTMLTYIREWPEEDKPEWETAIVMGKAPRALRTFIDTY